MSDPAKYALKLMKSVADLTDLHDVELVSGNDGQRFPAHRLILTASSEYFAALLGPNFREGKEKEVLLKEIDGSMLRAILDFVYTGDIEITADNVADIVDVASSMELVALEERCGEYWATMLDLENCVETYLNAEKYHLKDLWSKALKYIVEHFGAVPMDDFLQIDEKNFQALLKHDRITAVETVVFDRLVQWMNHNKADAVNVDSGLLEPIRLEHVPNAFLVKTIKPYFQKYGCEEMVMNELCNRLLYPKWLCLHRKKVYCSFMNYSKIEINIQIYDFDENNWDGSKKILIGARKQDFGSILLNREFFVIGGVKADYTCLSSVESYNVDSLTRRTVPFMQISRIKCTPICVGKYIYALGGYHYPGDMRTNLREVERFDTERRIWQSVSAAPRGFQDYAAIEFNGQIYVADRWSCSKKFFCCYDPDYDVWSEKAIPPGQISQPVLAKSKEFLYAIVSDKNNCTIFKYDSMRNIWSEAGTLSEFGQIIGAISHYNRIYILCSEGRFEDLKIDDCFFRLNSNTFPSIEGVQLFSD